MSTIARTTPPRPADVTAVFPELKDLARTTTRLHPRPGDPTAHDSSVAGPLLWPAGEPWPTCSGPHDYIGPHRTSPAAVARRRALLTEAYARPVEPGEQLVTDEERATMKRWAAEAAAIPMPDEVTLVPVAQLFARDVPGWAGPEGTDVLQVLWCPFDHGDDYIPAVTLRWRDAAAVGELLDPVPAPECVSDDGYLPEPCVLHPEQATEYPAPLELPDELNDRIQEHFPEGINYQSDLGVAPGWKLGGWSPWSFRDPWPMPCETCGTEVRPLLTIDGCEWDPGSKSWQPVEDGALEEARRGEPLRYRRPFAPTMVNIGRGYNLQVYVCPSSWEHPLQQVMQ